MHFHWVSGTFWGAKGFWNFPERRLYSAWISVRTRHSIRHKLYNRASRSTARYQNIEAVPSFFKNRISMLVSETFFCVSWATLLQIQNKLMLLSTKFCNLFKLKFLLWIILTFKGVITCSTHTHARVSALDQSTYWYISSLNNTDYSVKKLRVPIAQISQTISL